MKILKYKDILIIEDNIKESVSFISDLYISPNSIDNQFNSLDSLLDKVYKELKKEYKDANVVYRFGYGIKDNATNENKISFYGFGKIGKVDSKTYKKLADSIDNQMISLQFVCNNYLFYRNRPVQIDKIALYKFQNKFLGQIKLYNNSKEEIRKVLLHVQPINSFGELSNNIMKVEIQRSKNESNIFFGDESTVVFQDKDVANFSCKIIAVYLDDRIIHYDETDSIKINRSLHFYEILSPNEFEYLKTIKYPKFFNEKNMDIYSTIPFIYENILFDCNGNITDDSNFLDVSNVRAYIENDLKDELLEYENKQKEIKKEKEERIKQEQEKKKHQREININRIKKLIPKICVLIGCSIILCLGYSFISKNITYNNAVELLNNDNYLDALYKFSEVKDYKKSSDYIDTIIDKLIFSEEFLSIEKANEYLTLCGDKHEELSTLCQNILSVANNKYRQSSQWGSYYLSADYYLIHGIPYANVKYTNYLGTIYPKATVKLSTNSEYLIEIKSKGKFKYNDVEELNFNIGVEEAYSDMGYTLELYEVMEKEELTKDSLNIDEYLKESVSISDSVYQSISKENVIENINLIKQYMSFRGSHKNTVLSNNPSFKDDGWNRLEIEGEMFGIKGVYCLIYNRDDNTIYSVGFDWIPDDMDRHEIHVVDCIKKYFGSNYEIDYLNYDGKTYYYHDWDGTTSENWSVHLCMTFNSGWLQFSQLVNNNQ